MSELPEDFYLDVNSTRTSTIPGAFHGYIILALSLPAKSYLISINLE